MQAAIAIADQDGLAGVSMRNVAAALKAGPMRLYPYISTKDVLLDLMVDALYAELQSQGPLPREWRKAMWVNAQRLRELTQRHPWFLSLMGGRPHQGPHALEYLEALLAVLDQSGDFANMDAVMQALKTIQAYTIGGLHTEVSELRDERESGLSKSDWQAATAGHLFRMIETGRLPTIAKVVADASHPPAGVTFFDGLECVLDGVANRIGDARTGR
ncbi:MAG: TetR/AcrR family transcriptional regulator C-terminal domain-containing protein [Mycobacterium sp.]